MTPLRLSGILMTTLVHGSVIVGMVAFSQCPQAVEGPKLGQMVTIEAALAYKSKDPKSRQPQKPRRSKPTSAPQPETNPVSRDEAQDPVEPKPPEPPRQQEENFEEQFQRFRDMRQDEEDETAETDEGAGSEDQRAGGAFDGSEHGFAEVNTGDPYMRELAGLAHGFWNVPTLEQGSGHAVGCVQLGKDGRILDAQLLPPTQNATIDAAVKRALKQLTDAREAEPRPVPAHLLEATRQWLCFKFPY